MPISVPNRPTSRTRVIRVWEELWTEARDITHERGEHLAAVINDRIRRYIARAQREEKSGKVRPVTRPQRTPGTAAATKHGIRVTDDLWDQFKATAASRGENVSHVLVSELQAYVAEAKRAARDN